MNSARLNFLVRSAISLGLIWLVLHKVDLHQIGAQLQKADARWAATGSLMTLFLLGLLAARWSLFLRRQSIPVPFSTVFPLIWVGQFFNSVLPGSTGGDFVKIYQLCRLFPERKAASAVSVVLDRLTALVALVTMAGIAFLIRPISWSDITGGTRFGKPLWFLGLAAIGSVAIAIAALLLSRSERWRKRFSELLGALKTSFSPNWSLSAGIVMAFAIHLVNFLLVFCFARSLNLAITFGQVLLFMPVLLLLVMMPVTVNGHGLREVLLLFYFTKLGISVHGAPATSVQQSVIALSALLVANDLLWSLPGGLWYMVRLRGK